MNRERPPKKSETLEVRLPHAAKQAFMARCREDGRSASEVIREFIDGYLTRPSPRPERRKMSNLFQPALLTAAVAVAAAAAAHLLTERADGEVGRRLFDQSLHAIRTHLGRAA